MRLWSKLIRVSMYQALTRIKEKGWVETSSEKEGKLPEELFIRLDIIPPVEAIDQLEKRKKILSQLLNRISLYMITVMIVSSWEREQNVKLIYGYCQMELDWIEWLISELNGKVKGDKT